MIVRAISVFLLANGCGLSQAAADTAHDLSGLASIYAYAGERTANGETARPHDFTAAHRTLPFGTFVRVTRLDADRTVTVRINDRGPFVKGRVIDLTPSAAQELGFDHERGLAPVTLEVLTNAY